MKKSKLFMVSGAVILAISAVFATKANKKFAASLSTAASGGWKLQASASALIFTSHSATNYVIPYMYIYTLSSNTDIIGSSTTPAQLFTKTVGSTNPIFLYKNDF